MENENELVENIVDFESRQTVNDSTIKSRFSGMEWTKIMSNLNVLVIGAGGIGSWLIMHLARVGVNSITVYDNDKVECVNMSGQLIPWSGINRYKCDVVAEEVARYCGSVNIKSINERYNSFSESIMYDVILCAVDNMDTRKSVCNTIKTYNRIRPIMFIDGRLSVDELQIYSVICNNEDQLDTYLNNENCMFDDHEAFETVCNMKQTSYMANMIGVLMTNILVNTISCINEESANYIPFFTKYSSQDMDFVKMSYEEWIDYHKS